MATTRRLLLGAGALFFAGAGALLAIRQRPRGSAGPARDLGRLPEIRLNDLHGEPRALEEWAGRILLINFWATWCAPCRREMPLLQALQDARDPAGLTVIGIAIDRPEPVARFLAETGVTYPVLVGEQDAMAAAERFGSDFGALPFTVLVAAEGSVLMTYTGELHAPELARIIAIADQVDAGTLAVDEARQLLEAI